MSPSSVRTRSLEGAGHRSSPKTAPRTAFSFLYSRKPSREGRVSGREQSTTACVCRKRRMRSAMKSWTPVPAQSARNFSPEIHPPALASCPPAEPSPWAMNCARWGAGISRTALRTENLHPPSPCHDETATPSTPSTSRTRSLM